jgi:YQGE family putative transporter
MLSKLSPAAKRALLCHVLWTFGLAVADAFVNVYIYRLSKGYHQVAYFQIWRNLMVPIGFALATWLARRSSTSWAFRAGILSYELFYLVVLLLGAQSLQVLPALGCLLGLAMGVYWLGWQVLILDLSQDHQRDAFFSLSNLGCALVTMLGGPLAGWFLSRMPGVEGYRFAFGAASLIFLAAAWVSMPLSTPALPKAGGLRRLWQVTDRGLWRRSLIASGFRGLRDGALIFLVGVLVYEVTGSEANLGSYTALVSALGLGGSYLAGRLTTPSTRRRNLLLGACAVGAGILVLALRVDYTTLLIYGCITALMQPFFDIPYSSVQFMVFGTSKRLERRRADSLTLREVPMAIGRILGNGFLFFFVSAANTPALKAFMVVVGLVPLVVYLIIKPLFAVGERAAGSADRAF